MSAESEAIDPATFPALVIVRAADAAPQPAFPNLARRVLAYNDQLMLVEHTMEAGAVFPRHSHVHHQLAYLLSGHIRVTSEGDVFEARAGDSFVLRGGRDHEVVALERSVALDVFTPYREDYIVSRES